jgi:YbbR domain-containing protein
MARAPASTRSLLPRRRIDLRRALLSDLPLKATAVLIALIVWLVSLVNQTPPEVTRQFAGRVPIERPEVPAGYVLDGALGDVGVTLGGSEAAIGNVVGTDLHATIDLGKADLHVTDPQDVPVNVTVATPNVRVVDVSPRTVSVRIEPITTRPVAVQVRLANAPPAGNQAGDAALNPGEVRVSGATSHVARIAAVYATVRFGDTASDLVQTVQPVAVDASGAPIDGLTTDPAVVQVTVPVLPTATTRTVPVVWNIRGAVASGYGITRVTVDPPAVTLRGEPDAIRDVDHVDTGAADVTGLTSDKSFNVGLILPDGTSLFRPTGSTVTVSVAPLVGTRAFPLVAVVVNNLGASFVAETDPPNVSVVLAGSVPLLSALGGGQVTAVVDAAGRGPGSFAADVTIRAPSGATVQTVQPTRVTVTIRTRS